MRRIRLPHLSIGDHSLPEDQAHYLRDVLRLEPGAIVQAFDDAGQTADAELLSNADRLMLRIAQITPVPISQGRLTIASALPKGNRADWMIEKLSELGVERFIGLGTDRSVVHPQGTGKSDRWRRIAAEAARQSERVGVMEIEPIRPLAELIDESISGGCQVLALSTQGNAKPIDALRGEMSANREIVCLIGPEGGWSDGELQRFASPPIRCVTMMATILRTETAAVAAAAILKSLCLKES